MHLAIVDDNAWFRKLTHEVAKREGWKITEFRDGSELIDHYKNSDNRTEFDLLLIDVFMPNCDCFETIELLSDLQIDAPIAIVTGGGKLELVGSNAILTAASGIGKLHELKVVETLTKPVPISAFRNLLRETTLVKNA